MATSGHDADDDRIFFKEARTLAKGGAEVVVLCAKGRKPPAKTDGVRFANYGGSGCLKDRILNIRTFEQAIADQRCDVVHCHEPDGLIAALRVKRRFGVKVIFDSHELWSGVAAGRFPKLGWPLGAALFRSFERRWISRCDAAIGASCSISEYLASILGADRVATILNVPVVDVFGEGAKKVWGAETILCHDGHLPFGRGLKTMVEATRLLATRHRVIFKIVGDVFGAEKEWLDSYIAEHHLEGVIVRTGWLPYQDVGQAIAPCHIGLICLLPSPNNCIAAPNKCFNYLLYGLPIVGPAYPRSHFAILEREGCAALADPTSPEAYADALLTMISRRDKTAEMAVRARELSKSKYRWQHMEPILLDIYQRVISSTY